MPRLFGTSGIRGNLNHVSAELALNLGLALATSLKNTGDVAVGHDQRTSSPCLRSALSSGLMAGGCNVAQFGHVPTPVLAFGVKEREFDAGVIITGSHNPPTDNGLKCYSAAGREYTGEEERVLEELITKRSHRLMPWNQIGSVQNHGDITEGYVQGVLREIKPVEKPLHILVDCANGAGSIVTPRLLTQIGCRVTAINANMDGTFPGRPPEPTPENLTELSQLVLQLHADLAFAHDSDADRLSVLDEQGCYVTNDRLLAFFVKILLQDHGPGRVVTSVDTSLRIDEVAQRYGGQVERTRLGKTHEALLDEKKPVLCCEPWKVIDVHWGPWGDGMHAACKLVSQLARSGGALSRLLADIPDYPQRRISFPCPDELKHPVMEKIKTSLTAERNVKDLWTYDGVRLNYLEGSFVLVRPSGTEPRIRVYCEARSQKRLEDLAEKYTGLVKEATQAR